MSSPGSTLHSRNGGAGTSNFHDALRGCSLASLIWDTSLLRSSEDCPAAYDNSFPVNSVDIFLSHAWSDSGWWKQAALLTCCTPTIAYKAALLSSIVGAWLCWYLSYEWYELIVLLICFLSFIGSIITLLFFKHRNTTLFLDKCCINQIDFAEKMRGISRLSDYLRASDKLIILWSPNYLDRLWCVYELAVFMQTHDKKDVIILNLRHVKLCLQLLFLQLLGIVCTCTVKVKTSHSVSGILVSVVTSVLVGRQAFTSLQDWSTFSSKLTSFSVSNAKCTSPDDYTKLKQLITELYGSEDHFAACVRTLCLGGVNEKPAPLWLFSRDSLRIFSVPYVPIVAAGITHTLFRFVVGGNRVAILIRSPGADHLPLPNITIQILWSLRIHVFPIVVQCFRVPCMCIVGHKLVHRFYIEQRTNFVLLSICHCITFILYSCFTHALGGLHILYHPLVVPPIGSSTIELFLGIISVIWVYVLFIVVRRYYSHDLSNDILPRGC